MSQTPIIVTYDIKELFADLDKKMDDRFAAMDKKMDDRFTAMDKKMDDRFEKVDQRLEKLDTKVDRLEEKVNKLEVGQAEIRGDIKALDEKTSGLEKRVGNQEFLNRTTFGGVIVIIIGGMIKLVVDWLSFKP